MISVRTIVLLLSIICLSTPARADFQAGEDAYSRRDYVIAFREWSSLAEKGHGMAQFNLGGLYDNGQGIPQDYTMARKWYEKAAAQGNSQAKNNLGVLYEDGQGVSQDYGEAVKWYRKAAEQDLSYAQFNLAEMYFHGRGVGKNINEARVWYLKAAAQGYSKAIAALKALPGKVESPEQVPLIKSGTSPAPGQTAQEIAKNAFGSTVLLVMEDANGQPLTYGSGFFVREGEIASNLHVVKGAARGYAKLVGEKTKYDIEGIIAADSKRDLVILKISARLSPALFIGNSDVIQVGESVYAVGNPQGLEGTFSQGIISSIRDVGSDKLLQITAPISPGSSGGPVLSGKGEVIGVAVAFFSSGQNLNFAIPSNYLKTLMATVGPARPLAKANQSDLDRHIEEKKKGLEGKEKKIKQAKVMPHDTPRQTGSQITGRDGAPMALVPEGEFLYGNDKRRLKLKAFYMDKYEVSTSRYAKFLDYTASEKPTDWEQATPVKYGDRPVVGVDWTDASGYCKWAGKRLPTEEEWEKAARGTDGRTYPWGEEAPTRLHANFGRSTGSGYANLVPVDKLEDGESPYGMYNMAGNVWEWTSSDYLFPAKTLWPSLDEFLKVAGPDNPLHSKEDLTAYWKAHYGDRRMKVVRGGSWESSDINELQSSHQLFLNPINRPWKPHGFRCAQDVSR